MQELSGSSGVRHRVGACVAVVVAAVTLSFVASAQAHRVVVIHGKKAVATFHTPSV